MSTTDELHTGRLLLRRWRDEDDAPMTAINRDPEVTRYLNRPVTEVALAAFLPMFVEHWKQHGFGPFALESRQADDAGALIGFAGVAYPAYLPALAERPEIGWRLARSAWGRGLATEAALAARDHAFETLGFPELIAIVHPDNARSQAVARKLGMRVERQVHNPVLRRPVDVWRVSPVQLRTAAAAEPRRRPPG
ncbi:MAG TPA: GNAT family N-acetyltransferase [Conexibacter sp.]|nr:GNAT family N-acetyltransferase [Conexibacter sp.]